MSLFEISSIVIALSALFGYINVRMLKLPNTIGLMIIAILFTAVLFVSSLFSPVPIESAKSLIQSIKFEEVLMDVMLGFLLFAGAMHTNFDQLRVQRWPVLVFATLGVISSTFLVGGISYFVLGYLGLPMKFIHCLLFGALISPTDPIAVLGILKQAGVPKKLETKIVGESLFNDGVGVVVFLTIFSIATGGAGPGHGHEADSHSAIQQTIDSNVTTVSFQPTAEADDSEEDAKAATAEHAGEKEDGHAASHGGTDVLSVAKLFFVEVGGGILLGLILGYGTYVLLRSIDDYEIEVMITLACVMGGCSLAQYLHLSAPLAMVVAGLIVGNDTVRGTSMSKQTEIYVDKFWELIDILLNAILFVLIGLEILILQVETQYVIAGLVAIVIVLVSRYLSLILPVTFFAKRLQFVPHTTTIMTWGGLRGGISIALALILPEECRAVFLTITYIVVIFSIIGQGLTVGGLAKRLIGAENMEPASSGSH
ncbi:sodium:proton antiporter [bacterium]|nr:sodium:proton antiporter [bacterium]